MPQDWLYLLVGITMMSSVGIVIVAVMWMRKMRETVSAALCQAAEQQVRTAQHLSDSVTRIQRQQDSYTQQINTLAQAGLRLQQELANVHTRLNAAQSEGPNCSPTLH